MKRKEKATSRKETVLHTCNLCEYKYWGKFPVQAEKEKTTMIKHFELKHSDRMALCFDHYGQTWNAQYDACLKALHETTRQRDQAIKERDAVAAQQRTLATKLNAIVLVLRNDA